MVTEIVGPARWSGSRDREGHREWKVTWKVRGLVSDGPAQAMQTPGLFLPGATWNLGTDVDVWAWCRPETTCTPVVENEPFNYFLVEQTFSTRPPGTGPSSRPGESSRPPGTPVEDPLSEPDKVSGGTARFTEEVTYDVDREPVETSSHEQLRGPPVEFELGRDTIRVEQNVADLQLVLLSTLRDCTNDAPLWGLPVGAVRFAGYTWDRKYFGPSHSAYYTRTLEFEVSTRLEPDPEDPEEDVAVGGWDREVLDEGTKVIKGHWVRDEFSAYFGTWQTDDPGQDDWFWVIDPTGEDLPYVFEGTWAEVAAEPDVTGGGAVYGPFNEEPESAGGVVNDPANDPVAEDPFPPGPDPDNPADFVRFTDWNGNMAKVVLDGHGRPTHPRLAPGTGELLAPEAPDSEPGKILVRRYPRANLLLLGIPTSL